MGKHIKRIRMTEGGGSRGAAHIGPTAVPGPAEASRRPSTRTLRGLDGLNFLLADVQTGVGPFLAIHQRRNQTFRDPVES